MAKTIFRPVDEGQAEDWEAMLTYLVDYRELGNLKSTVRDWVTDLQRLRLPAGEELAVEELIEEAGITVDHPIVVRIQHAIRMRDPIVQPRVGATPREQMADRYRMLAQRAKNLGSEWNP